MKKLRFSGHDTFVVRSYWPKKGYDFLANDGEFSREDAVVHLGVGKNMVTSIQFWMKALGLLEEDNRTLTHFAHFLFKKDEGVDPYLENVGSTWLLHYFLLKTEYASIYSLVFNDLRKERSVFSKNQLSSFIKRRYDELDDNSLNSNTIEKDISTFIRLYRRPEFSMVKDFEEEINSLMMELGLLHSAVEEELKEGTNKKEKVEWFYLHGESRDDLHPLILLFSILDRFPEQLNIGFKTLEIEPNGPGLAFMLNRDGLYKKLKDLENLWDGIVLSETAGNVVLVLPEGINKWDVLQAYYGN